MLGAVFIFGGACSHLLPLLVGWNLDFLANPIHILSIAGVLSFWLLAKSLFEDEFHWRWRYLLMFLILVALSLLGHYLTYNDWQGHIHWIRQTPQQNGPWGLAPFMLMVFALLLASLYTALKDWRTDLVETRRRVRVIFVTLVAGLMFVISLIEFLVSGTRYAGQADIIGVVLGFFLIMGFSVWFLGFRWGNPAPIDQPISSAPATIE